MKALIGKHLPQFRYQQLYIMPSRYGYSYGLLLFIMLLGAMNYSNSLGHLLTFLLASLGLVGMLHCYRNLKGINVKSISAEPTFCGQQAELSIPINNASTHDCAQLTLAYKAKLDSGWNPLNRIRGYQHLALCDVLIANQTSVIKTRLPTEQRGWLRFNQLRLSSVYPLGLFQCWFYQTLPVQILVYPKPEGQCPLPLTFNTGEGKQQNNHAGQDDFAGLNRYRYGEPLHAVAWKSVARDDVMRSKQFSSEQGEQRLLSWQDTEILNDIEARLSQLCQWINTAERQGLIYGLDLPNQHIEPDRGETHQHRCLKALALYE